MEKKNRVSVWIGPGVDIEEVDDFLTEVYDEDESHCALWTALGESFVDHDLLEVDLQVAPVPVEDLLDGLSYLPSFDSAVLERCRLAGIEEGDALVAIYDFEPTNPAPEIGPGLRYIGTFEYEAAPF